MSRSTRIVFELLATSIASLSTFADTMVVDGIEWTYTISEGAATIENRVWDEEWWEWRVGPAISSATTGSISVPSAFNEVPVTRIGDYAFNRCSGLTTITIPDGVTSIGSYAFSGCSGLSSVTIPDGVTSIEASVFSGCSGLTSITIPDSVTNIGGSAFSGCSGLTSIIVVTTVTRSFGPRTTP